MRCSCRPEPLRCLRPDAGRIGRRRTGCNTTGGGRFHKTGRRPGRHRSGRHRSRRFPALTERAPCETFPETRPPGHACGAKCPAFFVGGTTYAQAVPSDAKQEAAARVILPACQRAAPSPRHPSVLRGAGLPLRREHRTHAPNWGVGATNARAPRAGSRRSRRSLPRCSTARSSSSSIAGSTGPSRPSKRST